MMRGIAYILLGCVLLGMNTGCSDRNGIGEYEVSSGKETLYLNLNVSLNHGTESSRSTSETATATEEESKIYSLQIFLFDTDTEELLYTANITDMKEAGTQESYLVKVNVSLPRTVKIFLAANLTEEQVNGIKDMKAVYTSIQPTYAKTINEFAPYSYTISMPGEVRRTNGIAMTGQAYQYTQGGMLEDIYIDGNTTEDNPLKISASLKRVVAKALLTVDKAPDDYRPAGSVEGVEYVKINSTEDRKAKSGWIRVDNVYYFPNGTNRKLYWFEQQGNVDPNPSLDDFISSDPGKDISLYTERYKNNFVYYDQVDQYKYYYAYNKAVPTRTSGEYTEGMYFLENTFDNDQTQYAADLERYTLSLPMVTSIVIAVKFTPKEVYVEKGLYTALEQGYGMSQKEKEKWAEMKDSGVYGGWVDFEHDLTGTDKTFMLTLRNEEDTDFVLTMSLKLMGRDYISSTEYGNQVINGTYDGNKFPDDTFFAYTPTANDATRSSINLYHYYTYGARRTLDDAIVFVPYIGGWTYYYTYIDGTGTSTGNKASYSVSQISRNNYYVMTLKQITRLGGSKIDPSRIQVNTAVEPWKSGGSLNVDLW